MDWLIDRQRSRSAEQTMSLLDAHLRRHAGSDRGVDQAVASVRAVVESLGADGWDLLRLHLAWHTDRPVVELSPVKDAGDIPPGPTVPAKDRHRLAAATGESVVRLELEVEPAVLEPFAEGPPPMTPIDSHPQRDGIATVAVALSRAAADHPSAKPAQQASLAGAALADQVAADSPPTDAAGVARMLAETHRALGSDLEVLAVTDEVVEVAVGRCPFGSGVGGNDALCHVTTGLAGRLGARVNGAATVAAPERIAAGDDECHLQVWLGSPDDLRGERHQWPPVTGPANGSVPRLDLSVNLPRETVSVPVVRRLAAQALRAFGVADDDIDDVQLAISEACANVIDHAADTDSYEVQVELAADRCAITVVDHGGGFDDSAALDEAHPTAESGRGLILMQALVDNLAFTNEPQAGTVVHMVKMLAYDASHPLWRDQLRPG
ncbi:ATP-binding protein [Nocardioides ungokensis]